MKILLRSPCTPIVIDKLMSCHVLSADHFAKVLKLVRYVSWFCKKCGIYVD